jgi:hypothetical protein
MEGFEYIEIEPSEGETPPDFSVWPSRKKPAEDSIRFRKKERPKGQLYLAVDPFRVFKLLQEIEGKKQSKLIEEQFKEEKVFETPAEVLIERERRNQLKKEHKRMKKELLNPVMKEEVSRERERRITERWLEDERKRDKIRNKQAISKLVKVVESLVQINRVEKEVEEKLNEVTDDGFYKIASAVDRDILRERVDEVYDKHEIEMSNQFEVLAAIDEEERETKRLNRYVETAARQLRAAKEEKLARAADVRLLVELEREASAHKSKYEHMVKRHKANGIHQEHELLRLYDEGERNKYYMSDKVREFGTNEKRSFETGRRLNKSGKDRFHYVRKHITYVMKKLRSMKKFSPGWVVMAKHATGVVCIYVNLQFLVWARNSSYLETGIKVSTCPMSDETDDKLIHRVHVIRKKLPAKEGKWSMPFKGCRVYLPKVERWLFDDSPSSLNKWKNIYRSQVLYRDQCTYNGDKLAEEDDYF